MDDRLPCPRLGDQRVAVAERRDAEPAREVEVLAPLGVDDAAALGAGPDHRPLRPRLSARACPPRCSRRSSGSPAGGGASTRTSARRTGRRRAAGGPRATSASPRAARTPSSIWNSYSSRSSAAPRPAAAPRRSATRRASRSRRSSRRRAARRARATKLARTSSSSWNATVGRLDVDPLAEPDVRPQVGEAAMSSSVRRRYACSTMPTLSRPSAAQLAVERAASRRSCDESSMSIRTKLPRRAASATTALEVRRGRGRVELEPERGQLDADVRVEPLALDRGERPPGTRCDRRGLLRRSDLLAEHVDRRQLRPPRGSAARRRGRRRRSVGPAM